MRTEGGDLAAVKQKLGIADAQFDTFLPLMHLRMWVDALVVKVYGALLPVTISRKMDRSRLSSSNNYDEALKLIEQFNPKHVYFYEMGYEQWLSHLLKSSIKINQNKYPMPVKWSLSVSAEISI